MRHDHGIRIGGALLVAVMMAASSLLMAAPALAATKNALAFVTTDGACCGAGYFGGLSGYVTAFVGSTPSTPSVFIPSGQISRTDTTTFTGPLTPFSINYNDVHNAAWHVNRQHSAAPTTTTTVNIIDKTSTAVGGDFYFPRYGVLRQTPGAHRFSGTLATVSALHTRGQFVASVGGYYDFTFNANATPMATAPPAVGQSGFVFTGTLIHSSISYKGRPLAFELPVVQTLMPATTGTQYVYKEYGYIQTKYTVAGYDNRTPSGLFGTLSMVQPTVLNYYALTVAPPPTNFLLETQAFVTRTTITFLPEPGSLLMLGCGILTLAGLFRLRMR
jgi:hypothetical protein